MTQSDYQQFATLIRQMPVEITKRQLIESLVLLFSLDNPRFNEEKFLKACDKETHRG